MESTPRTDAPAVDALRADLAAADFHVDRIAELLGPVATAALSREQVLPARLQARTTAEPAAVLTRAFLLGDVVRRAELDGALERLGADAAVGLGLVEAAGAGPDDEMRACVDLRPVDAAGGGWWIAADLGEATTGKAVTAEHVLGLGGAARTLAEMTIREPAGRVLDLGTGCGIQALNASRFGGHVVGTDISARALAFAQFNAALNDVPLDLRRGSLFEPVAGAFFDRVVSNPPFVITPRAANAGSALPTYTYRDGGRRGDDLVADLVTGMGAVLAPGGVAQLLANWEVRRGEDWTDRVRTWLEASGLDGWVIQRELADPAQYAETWLRDGGITPERDPAAWEAGYTAWLGDFAARGVEAIGFGYVTLRRPGSPAAGSAPDAAAGGTGQRWHRLEEITGTISPALGQTIAATLAAQEVLAALTDEQFAHRRLATARDVTEERHHEPGASDPRVIVLRQGGGLGRTIRADTALAAVVGACDGELTVAQIVGAVAHLMEVSAPALRAEVLPTLRGLVLDGLLLLQ